MLIVVDANMLVGELLRKRGREILADENLEVVVSERARSEAGYEIARRFEAMVSGTGMDGGEADELREAASGLLEGVVVMPEILYGGYMEEAHERIPRDDADAPNVALALALDSDADRCRGIWTNDKDYLGCGVATWTTETLRPQIKRLYGTNAADI